MSSQPFLQLYVGDYLSDTTDLTCEEHGAYLLLLMTMWRHGAQLPNDDVKLARITRLSPRRWRMVWAEIGRFFVVEGDAISSPRLTKEYQKASEKSEIRRDAGRKGGIAKSLKEKEAALAKATVLPQQGQISEPEVREVREERDISSYEEIVKPSSVDDVAEAVLAYNEAAERTGWPKVQKLTPSRRSVLKGRLSDCGGMEGWRHAVALAEESDFLSGRSGKWRMTFDWITKQGNFTKLMEGNYENRDGGYKPDSRQAATNERFARLVAAAASSF